MAGFLVRSDLPVGHIRLLLACIVLLCGIAGCDQPEGTDDRPVLGSVWGFEIVTVRNYTIPHVPIGNPCVEPEIAEYCENFGPSRTVSAGKFEVASTEDELGSQEYPLQLIEYNLGVTYEHRNWRIPESGTTCTPNSGHLVVDPQLFDFTGEYEDWSDGEAQFHLHITRTDAEWPQDHIIPSNCTGFILGAATAWTEYYTPHLPSATYAVEAVDGATTSVTEEQLIEIDAITTRVWCESGCNPPEDPCDPEFVRNQCEEFLDSVRNFCPTLDDWMIVITEGDAPPRHECETADCSDAIDRNESQDPWAGLSFSYDSACSSQEGNQICGVECYGWAQPQ